MKLTKEENRAYVADTVQNSRKLFMNKSFVLSDEDLLSHCWGLKYLKHVPSDISFGEESVMFYLFVLHEIAKIVVNDEISNMGVTFCDKFLRLRRDNEESNNTNPNRFIWDFEGIDFCENGYTF